MIPSEHPVLQSMVEIVEDIQACQDRIDVLKQRIGHLKEELGEVTLSLSGVEPTSDRLEIAQHAYWRLPEVSAVDLTIAMTGGRNVPDLLKLLEPFVTEVGCIECGEELPVSNRTEMKKLLDSARSNGKHGFQFDLTCKKCRARESAKRDEKDARERAAHCARRAELRAMTYQEYRQTPEWKHTRKKHIELQDYIHGEGFSPICEGCNAPKPDLEVYHTSLDRIGNEADSDLVVLCLDCQKGVREHGGLAA